jgi:hypothetical protein
MRRTLLRSRPQPLAAGSLLPSAGASAQQCRVAHQAGPPPGRLPRRAPRPTSRRAPSPSRCPARWASRWWSTTGPARRATSRPTSWPRPPTTTRIGVVINGNLTSSKMLYSRLPYDPARDFTYLSLASTTAPLVLLAPANQPAERRGLPSTRPARRATPGATVRSASARSATSAPSSCKSKVTGHEAAQHVPYQGNPQVVTDHDRRPGPDRPHPARRRHCPRSGPASSRPSA